ncbi:hypothetical protein [Planctomicrobium sp. SH664]|uniref:hypothetical protein n=1 Tax=Planctomicrobium sp. SH664 TaxID=3448125 RepID=UPI003F5C9EB6
MLAAQASAKLQEVLNQSTLVWIGLGVAFIVMAVVVHRIRAWCQGSNDLADTSDQIVEQMEELNRRGDLSDEEFRSIKGQTLARRQQNIAAVIREQSKRPT